MLIIWPSAFELSIEDGVARIVDSTGRVVAQVGDKVRFSAFSVPYGWGVKHVGLDEIKHFCEGSYWAVGDDFRAAEAQ